MKITSAHRLCGLGFILLIALAICSLNFSRRGEAPFMIPLAVAGFAYLLAFCELISTPKFSKRVVVFSLTLAALWHVLFLRMTPGPDDDIHRYVWDGRLQRLGYNPYGVIPGNPAYSNLHTAETRTLNHPDLPSPYPPGAQLFFRAVTAIHESVFAMKIALVLCELPMVFVLLNFLRHSGQGEHWVLAFAWNPLLAIEVAGSGHIDIVGVLLLLISAVALVRRWRAIAAVTFALAVAVKFLPIVLLPLYWKRVRVRDAALAFIVFALLYLPFLNHGRIPVGSLGTYVQSFRFNDPVFAALERIMAPQIAAGLALLAGFALAIWFRTRSSTSSSEAFAWPMAASLVCAPVVYPWYLVWLLPFLRAASTAPLAVWTVSIMPAYYVWRLRALGRPWIVPNWGMLIEYGSLVLAALLVVFRPGTRSAFLQPSAGQIEAQDNRAIRNL